VRAFIVGMVDGGALEVDGEAPLETVDPLYERVPACAVCGAPSENHPILFWKYNTPVVRCTTCGLLYSNPRWKAEHLFGRYTPEYWQKYSADMSRHVPDLAANRARYYPFLDRLEPARRDGHLLDVGCATGEFMIAAAERGWRPFGVETSPLSAQRARELTGAEVHNGSLETAPFADGWFDAVAFLDVIEHVQDPAAYIARIARLLRPGGLLLLTTPNLHSLSYFLLGRNWEVVGPNEHIYYFAPRTLQRLLARFGFSVHSMETLGVDAAPWVEGRASALKPLTPLLTRLARPLARRFLLGEQVYLVARKAG
jgi:SAM-dependent methyltransferase